MARLAPSTEARLPGALPAAAPRAEPGRQPTGVLVVTAAYPAPSEPTRAIFIENLCRELAALREPGGGPRFELAVVAPRIHRADPRRELRAGIPVRRFPYPSGGKRLKEAGSIPYPALAAYLASGLAAVLAEVRRVRPAVIHSHWVLPAGVLGALAGSACGLPHVAHAHGSDIHRYGASSRLARGVTRWVLARSRLVLSVSGAASEALRAEFRVRGERLRELPMGLDGAVFGPGARGKPPFGTEGKCEPPFGTEGKGEPPFGTEGKGKPPFGTEGKGKPPFGTEGKGAARRELGLGEQSRELLYAGDLLPEKGIAAVAEALLEGPRPPYRINLAGDGPDRSRLEGLARRSPDRLRLLGRLDPADLARWYRAADLLLLPSRGEGTPVTILEALASGLPVVATAVGGIPALVRPGREGWLTAAGAGPEEFLAVVEAALADPAALESLRASILSGGEDRTAARRARDLAPLLEEVAAGLRNSR